MKYKGILVEMGVLQTSPFEASYTVTLYRVAPILYKEIVYSWDDVQYIDMKGNLEIVIEKTETRIAPSLGIVLVVDDEMYDTYKRLTIETEETESFTEQSRPLKRIIDRFTR